MNIQVAIRLRPLIKREKDERKEIVAFDRGNLVILNDGDTSLTFDQVFGPSCSTEEVYSKACHPIVYSCLHGMNGTIFAYGQTSSGKTFTILGSEHHPGIVQLAISDIFRLIEASLEREFVILAAIMELYNECLIDMQTERTNLQLSDDGSEVKVKKLHWEGIESEEQLLNLVALADQRRKIAATNLNERSSRSHTIIQLRIESRLVQREDKGPAGVQAEAEDGAVQFATLSLVDLAGSENVSKSKVEGAQLKEAANINLSLLHLSSIIRTLSNVKQDGAFLSYRNSKLTHLLKTSIGGNAKTAIICCVAPTMLDETKRSLQFAVNAKRIKNEPVVNEVLTDEVELKRLRKQVTQLEKQLVEKASSEYQEKLDKLHRLLLSSSQPRAVKSRRVDAVNMTWAPGVAEQSTTVESPSTSFNETDKPSRKRLRKFVSEGLIDKPVVTLAKENEELRMKIVHLEQEKTEIAKKYETLCTVDDLVFQRTELECTMNPTLTPDRMHRRDFNASQMPGDTSILQNRTIQNILSRWNRPLDQTAMFGPTPFELHKVDASVQTEVVAEDEDAMRRELLIKEQEIERLKKTNERLNKVLRDQYAAIDHYRQSFIDLGREDEEEIEQLNEQIGQLESQLRELQQKSNAEHSQQHADEWATLKRKLVKDDDGVSECSEAKKENVLQGVQP